MEDKNARRSLPVRVLLWAGQQLAALTVAALLTLALFLILPVMQTIGGFSADDLMVRDFEVAHLPPPPPPPEEEQEEEEEEPEEPPELQETQAPLELAQLELALNPTPGDGVFGDFKVDLVNQLAGDQGNEEMDRVFSLAELDQKPRVIFQRMPRYPPELRRSNRKGTVYVVFMVDTTGRVQQPKVANATDPAFARPALEAVKQWKFEPGTRNGEKVSFKMKVPITFNAG